MPYPRPKGLEVTARGFAAGFVVVPVEPDVCVLFLFDTYHCSGAFTT